MNAVSGYILVVEDIPNILELIETTLKFKGGYRVVAARDGVEALSVIRQRLPSLVVTDILMPRMDGFSLVHQLRLDPATRHIPVIFLSATYVAPEDKSFAALIGATRFLEKPIDIDLLMKTVADLLTQEFAVPSEPLKELEFYEGYRKRIRIKLDQKSKQIARLERLLPTVSEAEKESFTASLHATIAERGELQVHLEQVERRIEAIEKSR